MRLQLPIQKEPRIRHISTIVSAILIITFLPLSAIAKPTSNTCLPVVNIAKDLAKKHRNASLDVTESQASKYWRNASKGIYLDLVFRNSALEDRSILNDAKKIINQCPGVIAVRFTQYGGDGGSVYGLVRGNVREFSCPSGMGPENRPFKWGSECNP